MTARLVVSIRAMTCGMDRAPVGELDAEHPHAIELRMSDGADVSVANAIAQMKSGVEFVQMRDGVAVALQEAPCARCKEMVLK